jgi:hypothetical protein
MRIPKITPAQIKKWSDLELAERFLELEAIANNSDDAELRHSATGYAAMLAGAQVARAKRAIKAPKAQLAALNAVFPQ